MLSKILPLLVICIGLNGIKAGYGTDELSRIASEIKSVQAERSTVMAHDPTDICDRYDVDGCSVPFHLPYFDKKTFTPSCNRHDICYHCGVSYSHNKTVCDNLFFTNMMGACDNSYMSQVSLPDVQLHKHQIVEIFQEYSSEFQSVVGRYLGGITGRISNIDELWKYAQIYQDEILLEWRWILQKHLTQKHTEDRRHPLLVKLLTKKSFVSSRALENEEIAILGEALMRCQLHANEYWLAVAVFGKPSYHTEPEFYCQEAFVPKCLELIYE